MFRLDGRHHTINWLKNQQKKSNMTHVRPLMIDIYGKKYVGAD
jgi:hypothetical protein